MYNVRNAVIARLKFKGTHVRKSLVSLISVSYMQNDQLVYLKVDCSLDLKIVNISFKTSVSISWMFSWLPNPCPPPPPPPPQPRFRN